MRPSWRRRGDVERHLPVLAYARSRLEAFLDATYQGFKDHVASGRHMTPEAVEAVAKGRVWTGEEAKARGLVDALGGFEAALRLAERRLEWHPAHRSN